MRAMDLEADVEQFGASDVEHLIVEESARRLLVHRMRTLHRGVPGESHREAVEPAEDRRSTRDSG